MKKISVCAIVFFCLLCFVSQASATNGYFSHGYSIKNKAMAGAGVALPLDALANSMNPAGMAFVGDRLDFGLSFFNPNREYTVKGQPSGFPGTFGLAPGTVESDSEWFIIPAIGFNKILKEKHALGISIFGNGGMIDSIRKIQELGRLERQQIISETEVEELKNRLDSLKGKNGLDPEALLAQGRNVGLFPAHF